MRFAEPNIGLPPLAPRQTLQDSRNRTLEIEDVVPENEEVPDIKASSESTNPPSTTPDTDVETKQEDQETPDEEQPLKRRLRPRKSRVFYNEDWLGPQIPRRRKTVPANGKSAARKKTTPKKISKKTSSKKVTKTLKKKVETAEQSDQEEQSQASSPTQEPAQLGEIPDSEED